MRLSPTTHSMLLIGKRVVTVLLACVILQEWPTLAQVIGLGVTTFAMKMFESSKTPAGEKKQKASSSEDVRPLTKFEKFVASPTALASGTFSLICVCSCLATYV